MGNGGEVRESRGIANNCGDVLKDQVDRLYYRDHGRYNVHKPVL